MGFLDNLEKTLKEAEDKNRAEESKGLEREKETMFNQSGGRYIKRDFKVGKALKSDAGEASNLYGQVVDYANRYNLKIVNISKVQSGRGVHTYISAIFEQ